jgi:hypothetical protein
MLTPQTAGRPDQTSAATQFSELQTNATPPAASPSAARVFLQQLHHDLPGVSEIRLLHPHQPPILLWINTGDADALETALDQIETYNRQGYDAFAGIATRREAKDSGGGGKDDVVQTRALWVDLDGVTALPPLDPRLPAPSQVVHSGGGLHLYWLLETPLTADETLETLLDALAWATGGDPQVAERARILRLPGTINHKPQRGGAICQVVETHPERLYTPENFAPLLEAYTPVRVWPKLFANALHTGLEGVCRFWFYLHHLNTSQYQGQGWLPFDPQETAADLGVSRRSIDNWLRQDKTAGNLFFRDYDPARGRLHLRSQSEVAAALAVLAQKHGAFDADQTDDRPLLVPLDLLRGGGKSANWSCFCAAVFNGWLGQRRKGRYQITWELLERTWNRSRPQIERWIALAGIEREHNIAVLPLITALRPDHPDFETIATDPAGPNGPEDAGGLNRSGHHWYGVVHSIRCKFWQRGNTYQSNLTLLRKSRTGGQAVSMRRAVRQAVSPPEHARAIVGPPVRGSSRLTGHCSAEDGGGENARVRTNFDETEPFLKQRARQPARSLYLAQPRLNRQTGGAPIRVQRFSPSATYERQSNWQAALLEEREHPATARARPRRQRREATRLLRETGKKLSSSYPGL